jgi:nucleotide-binding universal stress UspA family protein
MTGPIVVGYDDSDAARRALARGIEEARASKRDLVVVSVAEMTVDPEGPQNFGSLDDSPARMIPLVEPPELTTMFAHAREQIEAARLSADYVWAAGEPASRIVDTAEEKKASLVVVGSHHHGFLARMMGGDVAGEVKRQFGADVIVVP